MSRSERKHRINANVCQSAKKAPIIWRKRSKPKMSGGGHRGSYGVFGEIGGENGYRGIRRGRSMAMAVAKWRR
jgi:hypothetical protein